MNTSWLGPLAQKWRNGQLEELHECLQERIGQQPHCAAARYLMGCRCLDVGRAATGVRHLMTAHRLEPDLESAALLVFTGLSWVARRTTPLLSVVLETWEEFRRPDFDRTARERALLDLLVPEPMQGRDLSGLARRLWRLPLETLRAQLREAATSADRARFPLLQIPA